MFPVAILSGGLATRLWPITEKVPKSLVPINNIPFIFYQLRRLKAQGVSKVVICVGHLGDIIKNQVGNGERFGLEILYSSDGAKLLGTGGAIKKAIDLLGDTFYIMYGDSFLTIEMSLVESAFMQCKKPALMVVFKNQNKIEPSNVNMLGSDVIEYNKKFLKPEMGYIDYGISVVNGGIFNDYPPGENFDLGEVFYTLSKSKRLAGLETGERFYEIGSIDGIAETSNYLQKINL